MAADYKHPDEAAMQRILERYPYSPEGAIIRSVSRVPSPRNTSTLPCAVTKPS